LQYFGSKLRLRTKEAGGRAKEEGICDSEGFKDAKRASSSRLSSIKLRQALKREGLAGRYEERDTFIAGIVPKDKSYHISPAPASRAMGQPKDTRHIHVNAAKCKYLGHDHDSFQGSVLA
jgi:hypothetical protein